MFNPDPIPEPYRFELEMDEMGAIKHYLNDLVCACAPDNQFSQDAIEHAINSGTVRPTGHLDTDVRAIISRYDPIIDAYRASHLPRASCQRRAA